jgi:hypothetical protein
MLSAMSSAKQRPVGPARVIVLGGGFGGVYTGLHLERLAAKGAPVEVSLVNRENYLVFQPMLAEVIGGDVGILDTATTRALTSLDLLVLPGSDFSALADSLAEFRSEFEEIARARAGSDAAHAASEPPA